MKNKKGFTLIELLAVIVVLAIILVIAVPRILETIKQSKIGSITSSTKLIAKTAEQKQLENESIGNTNTISCTGVAEYNTEDYGDCSITFNNNVATVTLKGKTGGRFEGITCTGTKDNVTCTEGDTTPEYVYSFDTPYYTYDSYTVTNALSCKTYIKNMALNMGALESQAERDSTSICNGEGVNKSYQTTNEWFNNNVGTDSWNIRYENITDFISRTGTEGNYTYTVTNTTSCKLYVKNFHINELEYTESKAERDSTSICNGEGVNENYQTTSEWFVEGINNNNFTYDDIKDFATGTGILHNVVEDYKDLNKNLFIRWPGDTTNFEETDQYEMCTMYKANENGGPTCFNTISGDNGESEVSKLFGESKYANSQGSGNRWRYSDTIGNEIWTCRYGTMISNTVCEYKDEVNEYACQGANCWNMNG